jgi:hypothetical protein
MGAVGLTVTLLAKSALPSLFAKTFWVDIKLL